MKTCSMCKQEKPLNEFGFKKTTPDQKQDRCKSCKKEYNDLNNPRINKLSMYVNGKYISRKHPLYKPGRYKTLTDAWTNLEIDQRSPEGAVYIVHNKAWPNWYKVGKAVVADDRLNGYQTSSPYRDYELVYSVEFDNRHKAESDVHKLLRNVISEGYYQNEWFKADLDVIKDMIDTVKVIEKQLDIFMEAV